MKRILSLLLLASVLLANSVKAGTPINMINTGTNGTSPFVATAQVNYTVGLFTDVDITQAQSTSWVAPTFTVNLKSTNPSSTSIQGVVFTLSASQDGTNFMNTGANTFTMTVNFNGANPVIVSASPPPSFYQNMTKIRCLNVVNGGFPPDNAYITLSVRQIN